MGTTTTNGSTLAAQLHSTCFACNESHPTGLKLQFTQTAEGEIHSTLDMDETFQGYNGMIHGGIIATILDAAMTHCLMVKGIAALTAELKVRYRNPLPAGSRITVAAQLKKERSPLFELQATMTRGTQVIANATARFMEASDKLTPTHHSLCPHSHC
jgi:uncharacterized protein (TIGR00369 family)